jgi:hypothetical protein
MSKAAARVTPAKPPPAGCDQCRPYSVALAKVTAIAARLIEEGKRGMRPDTLFLGFLEREMRDALAACGLNAGRVR